MKTKIDVDDANMSGVRWEEVWNENWIATLVAFARNMKLSAPQGLPKGPDANLRQPYEPGE